MLGGVVRVPGNGHPYPISACHSYARPRTVAVTPSIYTSERPTQYCLTGRHPRGHPRR